MTVHIGFTDKDKLSEWWSAIQFSVNFRQWEFYHHIYQTSGQYKTMSARAYTNDIIYTQSTYNQM